MAGAIWGCHLWATKFTKSSLAVFLMRRNTSHRYLKGSILYALQFAKIVSVLASLTPPSGLPTKKLWLRYFASLRISLSTLLFEKSSAPFFKQCSRQGYSFLAYFTALTSSGSFSGSSSFSSMSSLSLILCSIGPICRTRSCAILSKSFL